MGDQCTTVSLSSTRRQFSHNLAERKAESCQWKVMELNLMSRYWTTSCTFIQLLVVTRVVHCLLDLVHAKIRASSLWPDLLCALLQVILSNLYLWLYFCNQISGNNSIPMSREIKMTMTWAELQSTLCFGMVNLRQWVRHAKLQTPNLLGGRSNHPQRKVYSMLLCSVLARNMAINGKREVPAWCYYCNSTHLSKLDRKNSEARYTQEEFSMSGHICWECNLTSPYKWENPTQLHHFTPFPSVL